MTAFDYQFKKAINYENIGNLKKAKDIYLNIKKKLPNHPQIFANLGVLEYRMGNEIAALQHLKKSIALDQNQPAILTNIGIILVAQKSIMKEYPI